MAVCLLVWLFVLWFVHFCCLCILFFSVLALFWVVFFLWLLCFYTLSRDESREKCVYILHINHSDNVWQVVDSSGKAFRFLNVWRKLTWGGRTVEGGVGRSFSYFSSWHDISWTPEGKIPGSLHIIQALPAGGPPLISKKKLYLLTNPWQLVGYFWSVAIFATDDWSFSPKAWINGWTGKKFPVALDCHFRFQEVHLVSICSWISPAPALGLAVLRKSMIHQKFGKVLIPLVN